jgi:hypothetical protein
MPTRATETHRFDVEPFRAKPVAQITPVEATGIIGTRLQLSGAGSTVQGSYDNLTFFWKLSARPVDSAAALSLSQTADKAVELEGDITGTYTVSLYVEADGVKSDTVQASVFFSPAVVPAVRRIDVDGTFMFNVLSDFWKLVNDREIFPIVWSGMTQAVASDFLRAVQVDRAKSIATVQPLFQKRWLKYSPELPLDPASTDIIYGGIQSGTGAFTGSVTFVAKAVVLSAKEVLITGPTTIRAIGTTMTLFSGTSRGTYLINRLNADGSGYIVSDEIALGGVEEVESGVTLVAAAASYDTVYDLSADFSSVSAGDYLQILVGANAGFYEIADVISSTSLALVDRVPALTSNMKYRVLRAVRASFKSPQSAYTDTVYIPATQANLPLFDAASLQGTGALINNFEIRLEGRHVLDSIQGSRIRILSGSRAGLVLEIASLNQSLTGVVISSKIQGTVFPETVQYAVDLRFGFEDRMLVLDGVGHQVAAYELLEGLSSEEEGGRGNLWAVTLAAPTAPAGREGIRWRLCPTYRSDSVEDFERLGVSAGDVIEFEVFRTDLEIGSTFKGQVFGAQGNKFAFDFGTTDIEFGKDENGNFYKGKIDAADLERLAVELSIPTVTISESGEALLTSSAFDIYELMHSTEFKNSWRNLPLDPSTNISLPGYFQFRIVPKKILRNSRIPLDPDNTLEHPVYSIPALFEYISTEQVARQADGTAVMTHKDETTSALKRSPVKLSENNDFSLTDTEIRGTALTTRTRSSVVQIADYALAFHGVRPGDELEIRTGLSQGSYVITSVVSDTEIRISPRIADGSLPVASQTSLEYTIRRRGVGRFIEFASRFTPASPAPAHLWAPLTLLDNFKYIEDNFGVLVGVRKADLDAYGTTQITFRSAVAGLMYAWASGPTLRSAEIGSHILLDLPVTEKPSEILTIDAEYTELYGRVVTEELDNEGLGTGIFNVFRYPRSDLYSLEKFKGLGINPLTGSTFAEGDFLLPFTPLTNSVIITDNVISPNWWREYSDVAGEVELQKYHTWQVEVDVRAVDSRDLPLAAQFLRNIRPIYTKPIVVAVLSLLDTVTVDAGLFLEMDAYFLDDPAFSRESSHAFDDFNGSGVALRRVDYGSRSTRTIFQGDDLVMSAGSGVVTSSRGGFSGNLSELVRLNSVFSEPVPARGLNLIRPGDRLLVLTGANYGLFDVQSVDSATQLTLTKHVEEVPRGIDIAAISSDTNVKFQILRDSTHVIAIGSSFEVEDTIGDDDIDLSNYVLADTTASFRSDGVAQGDRLIIESGDSRGVYVIEDLGTYDWTSEVFNDTETKLTVATQIPYSTGGAPYRIERWALLENPVYDGEGTGGADFITVTDADLMPIDRGDRIYDQDGTYYRVVGVSGDRIYVDRAAGSVTSLQIHKEMFEDLDGDSDGRLERLVGYDTVEMDIYRPLDQLETWTVELTADSAQVTVIGVVVEVPEPGDILAFSASLGDTPYGAYEILFADGDLLVLDGLFPESELATAVLCRPLAAFTLAGTTVTCDHDVEALGVRAGDFFEYESGGDAVTYLIIGVSGNEITLADDAGTDTVAGRIYRREIPSQGRLP